jgi:hypothetical protein
MIMLGLRSKVRPKEKFRICEAEYFSKLVHFCLPIEIGRSLSVPIFRDNRLCHFCSYNVVKKRHTLCWNVPCIRRKEKKNDARIFYTGVTVSPLASY